MQFQPAKIEWRASSDWKRSRYTLFVNGIARGMVYNREECVAYVSRQGRIDEEVYRGRSLAQAQKTLENAFQSL